MSTSARTSTDTTRFLDCKYFVSLLKVESWYRQNISCNIWLSDIAISRMTRGCTFALTVWRILIAKNLYKKLTEERKELLVVDWYKDEQPRMRVKSAIEASLDNDLPRSYDKDSFTSKISLLLNHFIDMAIQGYGWIAAA